ncbi:hypothetical protein H8B13_11660 [Hymenobacter sp. BT188]|uniref:hypothetical protein n=1 Tax=Hymenobacter sp. BT188 TaxID=2763504 RepID=UPI001651856B|nr:hypothetical protein [Hymenobacter sp. BT188]MBC6607475.1 hypothetical protein [Hymenobacter sp. BT188]
MKSNYSILVSSTDSYSDCWVPFFTLFKKYWPHYQGRIFLSTETKDFSFPGLDITCTRVARFTGSVNTPHGERLLEAFKQIDTDIVVYLHEDMFLDHYVPEEKVQQLVDTMLEHQMTYIGLVESGNQGPFHPSDFPDLWEVDHSDSYLFSAMASMWNIRRIARYFRPHENPWQTEFYVNRRVKPTKERFYTINRDLYSYPDHAIIPFAPITGIYRGKWHRDAVVDLFAAEGIEIDYSLRGFYTPGIDDEEPPKELSFKKLLSVVKSII